MIERETREREKWGRKKEKERQQEGGDSSAMYANANILRLPNRMNDVEG